MRRRANAEIEHGEFSLKLAVVRPMRMCNVIMTSRELREEMNDRENQPSQKPVRIIKYERQRRY